MNNVQTLLCFSSINAIMSDIHWADRWRALIEQSLKNNGKTANNVSRYTRVSSAQMLTIEWWSKITKNVPKLKLSWKKVPKWWDDSTVHLGVEYRGRMKGEGRSIRPSHGSINSSHSALILRVHEFRLKY